MISRIEIQRLFIYPLKSTKGLSIEKTDVDKQGFDNDRRVAVIDRNGRIVTGRDHPKLVLLSSELNEKYLILSSPLFLVTFSLPRKKSPVPIKLFGNRIVGIPFNRNANDWISQYLDGEFKLVYLGEQFRPITEKRGGRQGDITGFADSSPIHLISETSLETLNSNLSDKVTAMNFRPNIVVRGNEAFEEDRWDRVTINGLEYRVQERTQRCIFTTVDPDIGTFDSTMQPLASIAKMRSASGQRPTFGINLVPSGKGSVNVGDEIGVSVKI